MQKKRISNAVIRRLPRYYRFLNTLVDEGVERISSAELSRRMNVTASQIRQDLNQFGGFGQQGYGYNVAYLRKEIGKVLGLNKKHSMAIIGVGNLGKAIVRSDDFRKNAFFVNALFDVDPEVIGKTYSDLVVRDVREISDYLKENPVDIAVLTVPKSSVVELANEIVEAGVKTIWNFAHCELDLPQDVAIENVYLVDSLMRLSYRDAHRNNR